MGRSIDSQNLATWGGEFDKNYLHYLSSYGRASKLDPQRPSPGIVVQ
jgi:hypothetical protein